MPSSLPPPPTNPHLLKRPLCLIAENWRRLIPLNLWWVLQLVPLSLALLNPGWLYELRLALSIYSILAIFPATGALFAALDPLVVGAPLPPRLLRQGLAAQFKNSFLRLLPLYSLFFWLRLAFLWFAGQGLMVEPMLVTLAAVILGVLSLYWGSVMVNVPALSAIGIFIASYKLLWHRPGQTLLAGMLSLAALGLGILSVAGILLIVPAWLVLIQLQLFHAVTAKAA